MDSILKLFTRCMACAVIATPFCLFSSSNVQQAERPLADVKFDYEKPAADFKKEFDTKAEQALRAQHKKTASAQNHRFFSMAANGLGFLLGIFATVVTGMMAVFYWPVVVYLFTIVPCYAFLLGAGLVGAVFVGPYIAYTCGAAYHQELNNDLVFKSTFVSKN